MLRIGLNFDLVVVVEIFLHFDLVVDVEISVLVNDPKVIKQLVHLKSCKNQYLQQNHAQFMWHQCSGDNLLSIMFN